jgi:hypothetical protein
MKLRALFSLIGRKKKKKKRDADIMVSS